MKKFIAGFTALMCIIANYTSMPVVHNFNEYALTTNAETTDSGTTTALTAGKFADKYLYKYADTSLYLHTLQQVTMKKTVEGEKVDISTWEDNGYTYGVFKVTVTDTSSGKKTAVNTEYHVGLIGVPDTELNVKQLSVKVPSDVSVYVTETLKSSLKSTTTATVLGSKAFSGSYLKTVDLKRSRKGVYSTLEIQLLANVLTLLKSHSRNQYFMWETPLSQTAVLKHLKQTVR